MRNNDVIRRAPCISGMVSVWGVNWMVTSPFQIQVQQPLEQLGYIPNTLTEGEEREREHAPD